ncbi:UNVERIFIED_CONTAM: hypothetical protein NY603_38525, partial [Bacteroidetes bacterium 56_B9]
SYASLQVQRLHMHNPIFSSSNDSSLAIHPRRRRGSVATDIRQPKDLDLLVFARDDAPTPV